MFIDTHFKPVSHVDPNDIEGGVPGEECEPATQEKNTNTTALVSEDPDTIKIRFPFHASRVPAKPYAPMPAGQHSLSRTLRFRVYF